MMIMTMKRIEIDVPETVVPYADVEGDREVLLRNAMLLYPYIKNDTISHGKAAEMLGIPKIELIELYGSVGIAYFDLTEEEFAEDLATLDKIGSVTVC